MAPEGTVTEGGTVTGLPEVSATTAPAVPAACDSVTVQVVVPGAGTAEGLQLSALTPGRLTPPVTASVPAVPPIVIPVPVPSDPLVFTTLMAAVWFVADVDTASVTVATVPFASAVEFKP